jgi:hypothetical protein
MEDRTGFACRSRREVFENAIVPYRSPFLALPAEVRLRIYEILFTGGMLHFDAPAGCSCAACSFNKHQNGHQILLTCRLCWNEGRSTLFRSTLWIFPARAWPSLELFTSNPASSEGAKLVRCISLGLIALEGQRSFDGLPSLEAIIVRANGFASLKTIVGSDSDALSDESIFYRVRNYVLARERFVTLACMLSEKRQFSLSLLVSLEFLLPDKVMPHRWQRRVRELLPSHVLHILIG